MEKSGPIAEPEEKGAKGITRVDFVYEEGEDARLATNLR